MTVITATSVIMPSTLLEAIKILHSAKCPEDVFGPDHVVAYREWAKLTHPDTAPKRLKTKAEEAFVLVQKWRDRAKDKAKKGTYGDYKPTITASIKTKTETYVLTSLVATGDMCDIYDAFTSKHTKLYVKVNRSPANNDLMRSEALHLSHLNKMLTGIETQFVPQFVDSLDITIGKEKRRANIFIPFANAVSLTQVHDAYPELDVRDAAWMFNRMIDGLYLIHSQGIIHGAVTPDHFLIEPSTHTGLLIDYAYSVKSGEKVKAISNTKWKAWYPREIINKEPVSFATDIFMAATTMIYLLGGDPTTGKIPNSVPTPIRGLLRACRLTHAFNRSCDNANELHKEFNTILKALYGPKKFRHFEMPSKL